MASGVLGSTFAGDGGDVGLQSIGACSSNAVEPKMNVLQRREDGDVEPQSLGTCSTYAVPRKVEVLQRCEAGDVGPQSLSTCSAYGVARKIKVLKRRSPIETARSRTFVYAGSYGS